MDDDDMFGAPPPLADSGSAEPFPAGDDAFGAPPLGDFDTPPADALPTFEDAPPMGMPDMGGGMPDMGGGMPDMGGGMPDMGGGMPDMGGGMGDMGMMGAPPDMPSGGMPDMGMMGSAMPDMTMPGMDGTLGPVAKWRIEQQERVAAKAAASASAEAAKIAEAQTALSEFYAEREEKTQKRAAENRAAEASYVEERDAAMIADSWDSVCKLVDLKEKAGQEVDTSRMRSLLTQLKHVA